ncbi:MAG: formylmethanofuran dehydrogenase subunit E family protein [Candidatus Bathyarchaeia archaeon]
MLDEKEDLTLEINKAENLHGHLGPFLVIGVKVARLAKKILNLNHSSCGELQVTAELPLVTPFSCIIDGVQALTQCTVGNQKLKIRNSKDNMAVSFEFKSQNRTLRIYVNPEVLEKLKDKLSKGESKEKLAWKTASMPESRLLKVENL